MAAIEQALHVPTPLKGAAPPSFPVLTRRPLQAHSPTVWGEEDYAVVPDLVEEARGCLGISSVLDAFATPENIRFKAYCTREDDAFSQSWDYATAGPCRSTPGSAARRGW